MDPDIVKYHSHGIEYDKIPETLNKYDVGVIFYKAYSENVVYCVSNKFYEYLSCGLDIWFSEAMKATWPFEYPQGNPSILKINFKKLNDYTDYHLFGGSDIPKMDMNLFCEVEYQKLYNVLVCER